MAWIESNQELGRHPKTKKFARLLAISLPEAVGYLHYLWWWALDFAQNGNLSKYDAADIADAILWEREPSVLMDALADAGFVDRDDNGELIIHDWQDYAGRLLDKRRSDADRKKQARNGARKSATVPLDKHEPSEGCPTTESGMSVGCPTDGAGNSTVPNSTITVPEGNNPPISPLAHDTTKSNLQDGRFTEFWDVYPKKVGKEAARKSWTRIKPNKELHAKILEAISRAKLSEQWRTENGRFIPNPTTWLNQGRWDDEPPQNLGPPLAQRSPMDDLRELHDYFAEEDGS